MDYSGLMMIVLMIGVFYLLVMRPENKRKKQAEEMRNSLKKGERITTIGGMTGRIVQVNENSVVFETSEDRVRIEIMKWGVQSTESMEQAAAAQQQRGGGLFGMKKAAEPEKKPDEGESAKKDEKGGFDPEIK